MVLRPILCPVFILHKIAKLASDFSLIKEPQKALEVIRLLLQFNFLSFYITKLGYQSAHQSLQLNWPNLCLKAELTWVHATCRIPPNCEITACQHRLCFNSVILLSLGTSLQLAASPSDVSAGQSKEYLQWMQIDGLERSHKFIISAVPKGWLIRLHFGMSRRDSVDNAVRLRLAIFAW